MVLRQAESFEIENIFVHVRLCRLTWVDTFFAIVFDAFSETFTQVLYCTQYIKHCFHLLFLWNGYSQRAIGTYQINLRIHDHEEEESLKQF